MFGDMHTLLSCGLRIVLSLTIYLPLLLNRSPLTPKPGPWHGIGCQPCNEIIFTVSADGRSLTNVSAHAGRDAMTCSDAAIVDGSSYCTCYGDARGTSYVAGTFTAAERVEGRYLLYWYYTFIEQNNWSGAPVARKGDACITPSHPHCTLPQHAL